MGILDVKNLSFEYSDIPVLSDVSFSVEKGEFLGVVGSNGSGKSTLLKLILGLIEPKSGEISIADKSKIGYVSQKATSFNYEFPASVSEVVGANLYSSIGLFRRIKAEHKAKISRTLARVGLEGFEDRLIGRLSGGQQQRVFIARALVCDPQILILDEPTVGVDSKSVRLVSSLIRELNTQGMTIIMTNHDTHSLIKMSDKILVIREDGSGKIVTKSEFAGYDFDEYED